MTVAIIIAVFGVVLFAILAMCIVTSGKDFDIHQQQLFTCLNCPRNIDMMQIPDCTNCHTYKQFVEKISKDADKNNDK